LQRQIGILEKENQRIRDENESKMAMTRDQNALLNEQMDKLRDENQELEMKTRFSQKN